MKRIKLGSVEILGYIGIAIWVATFFGKWIMLSILKKQITIKLHLFLCVWVFIFAFISELIHDMFLGSPFDTYDIVITMVAQLSIFFIPIITKDKYFSDYN